MEQLAVEVLGGFEADAGRAVKLGNDDTLGTVDDEGAAAGHHGELAHIDAFLLGAGFVLQLEGHIERGAEALAVAERVQRGDFRVLDVVSHEVEFDGLVVALDRKDLAENRLQARIRAFAGGHFLLKEFVIRAALNLNEVGRFDDLFEFPEIETFSHGVV